MTGTRRVFSTSVLHVGCQKDLPNPEAREVLEHIATGMTLFVEGWSSSVGSLFFTGCHLLLFLNSFLSEHQAPFRQPFPLRGILASTAASDPGRSPVVVVPFPPIIAGAPSPASLSCTACSVLGVTSSSDLQFSLLGTGADRHLTEISGEQNSTCFQSCLYFKICLKKQPDIIHSSQSRLLFLSRHAKWSPRRHRNSGWKAEAVV